MGCTASVADKKAAERAERHRNNGLPVMRYKFSMSSPIATFSFPLSASGSPDAPLPLPNETLLPPPPVIEELGLVDERSAQPFVVTAGRTGDGSPIEQSSPMPESSECSSTFSDLNASGRKAKKPQITPFPLAKKNNRPKKGTSSPETALTLSPGSPEAVPALSALAVPTATSATSLGPGSPVNTKFRHDALECTATPDALMNTGTPSDTRSAFSTPASPMEPPSVQLSPSKQPHIVAGLEKTVCPESPGSTPPPPPPARADGDDPLTAPRANSASAKGSAAARSRGSESRGSEVLSIASDDDDGADADPTARSSVPPSVFADSNRKTAGSSSRIRSMASKSGSQLRTVTSKSGTMFGQSSSERSDIAMSAITMRMSLSEDQAEECRLLSGGVNAGRAPLPLGNASISMGDVDSLAVAAAVAAATQGASTSTPPTHAPTAGVGQRLTERHGGGVGVAGAGASSMASPGPGNTTVSGRPTSREQENRSCPPGPSRRPEDRFAAMGCTLTRPLPEVLEQECDRDRSLNGPLRSDGVGALRTTAPNASCPAQGPLRATSRPTSRQNLFERLEPARHTTDAWHVGDGGGDGGSHPSASRPGRGTESVPGLDLSSTSLPGEAISGSVASAARRHRKQNQTEALMGASASSDFSSQPGTPRTPGAVYSTGLAGGTSPAPGTPLHQSDFQGFQSRTGGASASGGAAARMSPGGRVIPSPQRPPPLSPSGGRDASVNADGRRQSPGQVHGSSVAGGRSVSAMSSVASSVMAQLSRGALNDDSDSDDGSPPPPRVLGAAQSGADGPQRMQDGCHILQTNPTLQGGGILDVLSEGEAPSTYPLAPVPQQSAVSDSSASAGAVSGVSEEKASRSPQGSPVRASGARKVPGPLVFSASATKTAGAYGSNANLTPLRTHTPQLAETFSPFSAEPEKSTGKNPVGKLGALPPRATSPGASPSATNLGPPKSPGRLSATGRDRSALVSAFDHPTSKESSPNAGDLRPAVGLAGAGIPTRSPGQPPLLGGVGIPPPTGSFVGHGIGGNGTAALGPRSLEAEPHSASLIHGIIPSTSHSMLGSSRGSHGSLSPGSTPLNHSHGRFESGPVSATDLSLPSRQELEAQAQQALGQPTPNPSQGQTCVNPQHLASDGGGAPAGLSPLMRGGSPTNTTAHPTAGHGGGSGNGSPEARSRSERLRRLCGESNVGCDGGGVSKSPQRSAAFESSQL